MAGLGPQAHHPERRTVQRFPYPNLLYLTPVAADGMTPAGDSIVVVGKHLSERGLGFFYQHPLPNRRMIASMEGKDARWVGFLVDITWCRFTQHGWYDSGGRFLHAVPSPIESPRPLRRPRSTEENCRRLADTAQSPASSSDGGRAGDDSLCT